MKIALLTHSVNPRGGVVHTLELGEALTRLGHQVTIMALATPGQAFFRQTSCQLELVPIERIKDPSTFHLVDRRIKSYVTHLKSYLKNHQPDIFHAHDGIGANALLTLKQEGLIEHFVRTVHHLDVFENQAVQEWQSLSVSEADEVLAVSPFWQEKITKEFNRLVHLVNNGVDSKFFSNKNEHLQKEVKEQLGLSDLGPIILCLGGVEERKNTVRVLQAFHSILTEYPNAQLVIAGGASILDHSKYVELFNQTLEDLGLSKSPPSTLLLTGPIPHDWMPSLMQSANLVVMASIKEGFGLVTLEALCAGTPIVVSNIKPFTEYLSAEHCSWADPLRPESIAHAMKEAMASFSPSQTLRSAQTLANIFSWDASAQKHESIYQSLISKEKSTCP